MANLRTQIRVELSKNELTSNFTARQDNAIADLVLEFMAQEAEMATDLRVVVAQPTWGKQRAAELRAMRYKEQGNG